MTQKNKLLTSLLAGAALLSSQASAAVLFSDDFSGVGSGTGFSGNWDSGLTYNDGTGTFPDGTATVNLADSDPDNLFREFSTPIDTTTNFWLVANLTVTGSNSGYFGLGFRSGSTNNIFIGSSSAQTTWNFLGVDTGVATFSGIEEQIVMHFNGTTSVSMWINPADTSSEGALGTADGTFLGDSSTFAMWDDFRLASGNASPDPRVTMNNMIAATTFDEAVSPIPEPSTGLLLAFAASAMFLRRRRA